MAHPRSLCGILAMVLLLVGANLLVLQQTLFSLWVAVPLLLGIACGLAWLVMALMHVSRQVQKGRFLYNLNAVVTSILFLGVCMMIYVFIKHGGWSWDLTAEGRRTLAPQTVQVLENLNKDVDVICFFLQIDDELVRIAQEKTERFLELCQRHTPHLKIRLLDPQIDRAQLEGLKITHASTQGTIVIRCGTRQKVIMLQGGSPRLEERDFTNGLINVIRDTQPTIAFLTGHGERSTEDKDEKDGGTLLKTVLESESYQTERIAISITHPEIPPHCSVLFINGMGTSGLHGDLHPEEIKAIQAYLDHGGRLLLLMDPRRRIDASPNQVEQFAPWLKQRYGIIVGADMAVSPTEKWKVPFTANQAPFKEDTPETGFMGAFNARHPVTQHCDQNALFQAACTVRLDERMPSGVTGSQLLRTTPDFFAESDLAMLMSQGKAIKNPEEQQGPLSMGVAVTAKTDAAIGDSGQTRDARIVVFGDSDFAANGQIAAIPGNLNLILNAVAWLTENEDLIAIRPSSKQDPPVLLTDFDQRVLVWIAVLGTLQAVALAGLAAYTLRRKHQ